MTSQNIGQSTSGKPCLKYSSFRVHHLTFGILYFDWINEKTMTKTKTTFYCQNCGVESAKWVGKCPSCGEWNTYVEEVCC